MVIQVISHIPYLENITKFYYLDRQVTVNEFIHNLGVKWDVDALIVVNEVIISNKSMKLHDGDKLELLIPLSGG